MSENVPYVPFFEKAKEDVKWKHNFFPELITDLERLREVIAEIPPGAKVAFDTETTGLSFFKDYIVGFSFSTTPFDGYYVPIKHKQGLNCHPDSLKIFYNEVMLSHPMLMYNMVFDLFMLENEKLDPFAVKVFEVMILVHLADSNIKHNGLKAMAEWYCGRKAPSFEEAFGKKAQIDQLDPVDCVVYAANDSASTFALFDTLYPFLNQECALSIKIDTKFIKSLFWALHQDIYIDSKKMAALLETIKRRINLLETQIFKYAGHPFLLNSNRQMSNVLLALGLDNGKRTKLGDMPVGKDDLKMLDHPIIPIIAERDSLEKQASSYIEKLSKVDKIHCNYFPFRVPTARLASGSDGKNEYFANLNFQNLTKPHPKFYRVVPEGTVDFPGLMPAILGYDFIPVDSAYMKDNPGEWYAEGQDQELNVRSAIVVPNTDDWLYMGIDYAAEEVRIAAAIWNEPIWLKAFRDGEDTHKALAIRMYGEENYDKEKRKHAKIATFGMLYGGNEWTLQNSSGLPMDECKMIVERFWKAMVKLAQGQKRSISECIQHGGVTYNMYNRPRRLKSYLASTDRKIRSFGERSIKSHKVQSTAADIFRIAMVRLYEKVFQPYFDKIKFVGAIHDEINFYIKKNSLDLIDAVCDCMRVPLPGNAVNMEVEVSLGYSYGYMFAFEKVDGKWQPQRV